MLDDQIAKYAYIHLIQADPVLAPFVRKWGICSVRPKSGNQFDTLVSSIIGQQLSVTAADAIKRRVAVLVGHDRPFTPRDLVRCSQDTLAEAGLSKAKVRYVLHLAESVFNGELRLEELSLKSDQEIVQTLTQYPGIGQWTAEMFLIFSAGRPDVFSATDTGLRRAMSTLYSSGQPLDLVRIQAISIIWKPYRSIASWYLWRSLD